MPFLSTYLHMYMLKQGVCINMYTTFPRLASEFEIPQYSYQKLKKSNKYV